jgi:hypothetical protein
MSQPDQGGKIPRKGNNIKVASLGVCSSVIERWEKMLPLTSSRSVNKKFIKQGCLSCVFFKLFMDE